MGVHILHYIGRGARCMQIFPIKVSNALQHINQIASQIMNFLKFWSSKLIFLHFNAAHGKTLFAMQKQYSYWWNAYIMVQRITN